MCEFLKSKTFGIFAKTERFSEKNMKFPNNK